MQRTLDNDAGTHSADACVQGALSGVQALAMGLGPIFFMAVWKLVTRVVFLPRVRLPAASSVFRVAALVLSGIGR